MSVHLASEVKATYALRTKDELERTLPLEPDEQLLVAFYAVTEYSSCSIFAKTRTDLRLSTRRLCVVRHYGFISDRILVIPSDAVTAVEPEWPHGPVRVSFAGERGDAFIVIRPGVVPRRTDGVVTSNLVPLPFRQIIEAMRPDAESTTPVDAMRGRLDRSERLVTAVLARARRSIGAEQSRDGSA